MSECCDAAATPMQHKLKIVGIGCDGIDGLSARAMQVLTSATRIIGAPRQLALLADAQFTATLNQWPEKFWRDWSATLFALNPAEDVILASGDPMFHGVGVSIARHLGAENIEVFPAPSSVALACARLGWALHDTPALSLVTGAAGIHGAARVVPLADKGKPFLVLCRSAESINHIAQVLTAARSDESPTQNDTEIIALTNLGGPKDSAYPESITRGTVAHPPRAAGDLTVAAIIPHGRTRSWLADSDFETDGQLTKSPIRQLSITALDPLPGQLLFDVGGGTGSIAIEWARHGGRAVIFEQHAERAERIERNVDALSGNVEVVVGTAPQAVADYLEAQTASASGTASARPDAIFIGGGLTAPEMVKTCWNALADGGRLVANAVTVESEQLLWHWHKELGGELIRLEISHQHSIGRFSAWNAAFPVVQWRAVKSDSATIPEQKS